MDVCDFKKILETNDILSLVSGEEDVAVAVSGGADSLALFRLMVDFNSSGLLSRIHVLTVDHGIRKAAKEEAEYVHDISKGFKNVIHATLRWCGDKPATGLMEAAREARYELISKYCKKNNISFLFVGHHMDDQAETVLKRLVSGSSVRGLCGMSMLQSYDDDLTIVRPFLHVKKKELCKTCDVFGLEWIEDPTNKDSKYARGRYREFWDVLEKEGLTSERLSRLSVRMQKVESALNYFVDLFYESSVIKMGDDGSVLQVSFDLISLLAQPEEVRVRTVLKAMEGIVGGGYGPRLHRLESILTNMWPMKKGYVSSIGGCLLKIAPGQGVFCVIRET